MLELSSEKPGEGVLEEIPPPEPELEPEAEPVPERPADELSWDEDYDQHMDVEELPPPKPKKKKKRTGLLIVVLVIVIFLVIWTVLSPEIMPEVGDTYITDDYYANLGNYTGYREIWAGNMTWGVAIRGPTSTTVGTTINISVLLTKVFEKPGNWFFRGTAVSLRNVSFYHDNFGSISCVGTMSNWTHEEMGLVATVPIVLDQPGSYYLYLSMRFMVFMDMRIGYLPLETVDIPQAYLSVPIVVS